MKAIFKRELASYFRSPIGWVVIALFALIGGSYFSIFMSTTGKIDIRSELDLLQIFLVIIIPIMTMRLFSEEKKNGTDILLYTSSVSMVRIVLGKYLAALSLLGISLLPVILHIIILLIMGGLVDIMTLGALFGFILLASMYIAIGVMASAVTENQIIAALISAAVIIFSLLMTSLGTWLESILVSLLSILNPFKLSSEAIYKAGENFAGAINWLAPAPRLSSFSEGIFSISPILFFISVIALFLFLTYRVLEKKRWSQG